MKRIFLLLIIVILGLITFFQYENYKRFNPPSAYTYGVNDSIDVNYFDPVVLQQYYANVYELASFGRDKWANDGIDILFPEEDSKSQQAALYYRQLLSNTKRLEGLLIHSAHLKNKGYNNVDIKHMMEQGLSTKSYDILSQSQYLGLKVGDENQLVWELQKMLISLKYEIPKDGKFGLETEAALKDFQLKNDLYSSGVLNESTLKVLLNLK